MLLLDLKLPSRDGIRQVSFVQYAIGYFDLETGSMEPVNHPVGPKVVSVFPV